MAATLLAFAFLTAASSALAKPKPKTTLVIGLDISDTVNLDPARNAGYSSPSSLHTAYDSLVTMKPGDYTTLAPQLATSWARTSDGKGWRFKLRSGVKFASGNPMTADDVKWSIDRVLNIKDQPAQYVQNLAEVKVVDPMTIDFILKNPAQPILTILAAPSFAVIDSKLAKTQGGSAEANAKEADKATAWLNQHSAGTGPYMIVGWERNGSITMERNPNYWRGKPGFERVVVRHISDSAAQLLALRRGDIDAAFNLIPEQIATLKDNPDVTVKSQLSLDFVYMTLTSGAELNPALAKKEARQAVAMAIDYDGIRDALIGGSAQRPPAFLPIGVGGVTKELTKEIGHHQDLGKAKELLTKGGLGSGFSFDLAYGNASIAGISYQLLAQKIQSDLARVGIKANLQPMDQVNLRTQYSGGKATSVLTFWNPPAVETQLWAAASVERVAKRVHWTVPPELSKLVSDAASEENPAKKTAMWKQYQTAVVDQSNYLVLLQPIYRVGVRKGITGLDLTAAGWIFELASAKPSS
ncbi:MAG TPA: ABC transporter substrate-binding protein [Polyangia bacterium]|nr:ABC transporter substrate-binding protein [Polyangia bacterium]